MKIPQRSVTTRLRNALKIKSKNVQLKKLRLLSLIEIFDNQKINSWIVLKESIEYRKNYFKLGNYSSLEELSIINRWARISLNSLFFLEDYTKQYLCGNSNFELWIINSEIINRNKTSFCMLCACNRFDKQEGFLCTKCKNSPKLRICSNCSGRNNIKGILCGKCKKLRKANLI